MSVSADSYRGLGCCARLYQRGLILKKFYKNVRVHWLPTHSFTSVNSQSSRWLSHASPLSPRSQVLS